MSLNNCYYCKRRVIESPGGVSPDTSTVDHYRPRSIRGHRDPEETVIACRRCNSMKGATPPEVFQRYIQLFGERGLENQRAYRVFCYRLMVAGLRHEAAIHAVQDEFPWMSAAKMPA